MDISTTTTTSTSGSTSTSTTDAGSAITSDFDTFLKMLTTQLENQDPLNPMDSNEFAVQIATFSGVEQQVLTNDLLQELQGQFALLGMSQLSAWVGQEARTTADVWYDGSAITIVPDAAETADNLVLVVRDSDGNVVSREEVPVDSTEYSWLGADASGDPLEEGRYSLSIESRIGDEVIQTDAVESYATIQEARRDGDDILLVLRGGIEVDAADVTALRT